MTSTNDIRAAFLDFFAANGHTIVASGPLVPRNDPTLLFTNAGMVQFKNVFTGAESRDYVRAVTSQKCVRAGGKHNDLENVGYTTRHHTFFEMLGNFSFGDYFKEDAIELAWELIVKEFALAPDRLWVTVYHTDDEAFDLWRKISGLPEARILRIATADNFWAMGETGPCGPCSEIFYDHGEGLKGGPPGSADEDGDRFVEIWNLVFMQYEQVSADERRDLPKPCVDTGLGLERIAAILQGVHDNYDIDLMRHLIEASAEATNTPPDGDHAISHRVIADHLRAVCFLMADGVMPSNEGRGYVLRRILRRAMRHAHLIGFTEPLLSRLVPALITEMGQAFPELIRAEALLGETLKGEETRFLRTLDRGMRLLDDETAKLAPGASLAGEVAFKLYDTYGFPLDLTEDALRARGIGVEVAGFDQAMERQRAEARAAWAGSGETADDAIWFGIGQAKGATEFLGYATDTAEGVVVALLADGKEVESADAGAELAVVTNQTPFYGEAGGQVGDTGNLASTKGAAFTVTDTKKMPGGLHVHLGTLTAGALAVGDTVAMRVDAGRRRMIRANHSATHLMHEALRRRLGRHVTQKGSHVGPDRLRFDISHAKQITAEEIKDIEADVGRMVRQNREVTTRLMTPDDAIEAGAMALFGEKYGDEVRVVTMGADEGGLEEGGENEGGVQEGDGGGDYSVELCGGTHVARSGDIGTFKLVAESALAAGVRRIEALTGAAAEAYMAEHADWLAEAAAALKTAPAEVPGRVAALLDEKRKLERELSDARRRLAVGGAGTGAGAEDAGDGGLFKEVGGIKYAGRKLSGVPAKELKSMADELKARIGTGVVAIAAVNDGKASLVVAVTDDLTESFDAVKFVRIGAEALGGKGGGGRPDMAQAGGPDGTKADDALSAIERAVEETAAPG
jgi:alanyl-tRNA synthetase